MRRLRNPPCVLLFSTFSTFLLVAFVGVFEVLSFATTGLVGVCGSSVNVCSGGNVNDVAAAFLFLLCGFTGYGVRKGFSFCN